MAGRGLWDVLIEVAPGLSHAGRVERASTSAGLMNTATGECFGGGGMHVFIHVADAADIPRANKALHDRCALAGYGWAMVSKSGQILRRAITDLAVGTAEHLAFEGPPVVAAPLMQDADTRKPKAVSGGIVDTRTAIPDLTTVEKRTLKAMRDAMASALAAAAAEAQRLHMDALTARVLKNPNCKTPAALLRERLMLSYRGRLAPEFPLEFDDQTIGVKVSVAEVLADPARFIGETSLSDPLEGPELWAVQGDNHGGQPRGRVVHPQLRAWRHGLPPDAGREHAARIDPRLRPRRRPGGVRRGAGARSVVPGQRGDPDRRVRDARPGHA